MRRRKKESVRREYGASPFWPSALCVLKRHGTKGFPGTLPGFGQPAFSTAAALSRIEARRWGHALAGADNGHDVQQQ